MPVIDSAKKECGVSAYISQNNNNALSDRIIGLDILRGIAVLGIFWMNIQSFAAPFSSYSNPMSFGDLNGANFWAWALAHMFAELKFMTIFSILFGVGLVIFYQRAEAKGLNAFELNMQRMLWLMVFGVIHAYVIWFGDILFLYAVCGLVVVKCINLSTKKLLILSSTLFLVPVFLIYLMHLIFAVAGQELLAEVAPLWAPSEAELASEIAAYKGSWLEARIQSAETAFSIQMSGLFLFAWRATACMLLGIVMLRTGFITGALSIKTYCYAAIIGLTVGLSLSAYGIAENLSHEFSFVYSGSIGILPNYLGSLATSVAYIALIMLLIKSNALPRLQTLLANVGKMAFSNYIMQSLLGTFIFYGFGLSYFAELSRVSLMYVVLFVWALQLIGSSLWLNRFQQGPLEQFWRYLTYR